MTSEKLPKLGPFPAGVNNVAKEDSLPVDENGNQTSLRSAINVDLDNDGWPSRRQGRELMVEADRAHSLFPTADHLFGVVDGDLKAYNASFAEQTVRAGVGPRFASFAHVNDDVFWTNGVTHRRVAADLSDHPNAIATPTPPIATAAASGGLAAGEYLVSLTWSDVDGRESGASHPVVVDVAANGGIMLTNLPAAPEDAVTLHAYASPPNADPAILYRAYSLPAGATTLLLGKHQPGVTLKTQWLVPLPPGDIVRLFNGRLLVAFGAMLAWSDALRFGLMHPDNTLRMGQGITLMEPVGDGGDAGAGVFIADHKRTYFLSGNGPEQWQRVIRYPHSAVPGTSLLVPGNVLGLETTQLVAFWLATNGVFCIGMPGGTVAPVTEDRLALPEGERGAVMFREVDGLRQLITSFITGGGNRFGVSDSAVGTVRRHGVTLD